MPFLEAEGLADLVETTIRKYRRFSYTAIAADRQKYFFLPNILKREQVTFDGGTAIEWKVMVKPGGNARHIGLYHTDTPNVLNVMQSATIPWRHTRTHYEFDLHEQAMNSGAQKIVDTIRARRAAEFIGLSDLLESTGWGIPGASTDTITPFGVKYWIFSQPETVGTPAYSTPFDLASDGGFLNLNHANYTSGPGGLSRATYGNWGNWNHQYGNITPDDAVDKLIGACRKTKFEAPVDLNELRKGSSKRWIYTTDTNDRTLAKVTRQQNDQVGRDLAEYDGKVVIRGVPVQWVPILDDETDAPFIGIDWSQFYAVILRGWHFRESKPRVSDSQPHVVKVGIDLSWNMKCANPRGQFKLTT
jgi:hypothetical protein